MCCVEKQVSKVGGSKTSQTLKACTNIEIHTSITFFKVPKLCNLMYQQWTC